MHHSSFEARPPQDTIDVLVDYVEARGQLSDQAEAIIAEAWAQHDAYPCKSGRAVREAIVGTALAELVQLEVPHEPAQHQLKVVELRAS